jgi:hypothetical protein
MIISVHIPKCGGISFQHILRSIYGNRRVWLNYGTIFDQADARARCQLMPPGLRCVHGHFLSDAFDQLVPDGERVTWLRRPVERVISNYYHFLRHPDPANPCCRELWARGLSLQKFAELPMMANEMTRYLAGKPVRSFKFVGIMERYTDSLRVFGSAFGVPVPGSPPRENVNPHWKGESYPVPDWLHAHIEAINGADLVAYDAAVAELERGLARAEPPRPVPLFSRLAARAGAQARLGGSSVFSLSR